MVVLLPMPACMSVRRVVTAANRATHQTRPEVNPSAAHGDTLITHIGSGLHRIGEGLKVAACSRAHSLVPLVNAFRILS